MPRIPVDDTSDIPKSAPTGALRVELTSGADGEVNSSVTEVWVRFEDVQVHQDDKGWLSVADERQDVDLMSLRSGKTVQIGRGDVYEGAYGTLRLIIADAWLLVDGGEVDLDIKQDLPDLAMPGIDLAENFFVDHGTVTPPCRPNGT